MGDRILIKLKQFLELKGFKEVENQKTTESFGDYLIVFSSSFFDMRVSSSRSFEMVDIRSKNDIANWFDLALIKALIYEETNLNRPTSMNEMVSFFIDNFELVRDMFSTGSYTKTKIRLEELEKLRASQMFPNIS